jgi:hypothetical protein
VTLNETFAVAFQDELEKIGSIGKAVKSVLPMLVSHSPSVVAAGLGGVAVYDLSKATQAPGLDASRLSGSPTERVSTKSTVTKFLKRHSLKRPVVAVTTRNEARKMIDELEAADPTTKHWSDEERVGSMGAMLEIIGRGENAGMLDGKIFGKKNKNLYILAPPKANRVVLEHELGHAVDETRKGKKDPSAMTHLTSLVWWPSYKKTDMGPEERAWSYADLRNKRDRDLKDAALGTYEGGFHGRRGILGGLLGAGLLVGRYAIPAALKAMKRGK